MLRDPCQFKNAGLVGSFKEIFIFESLCFDSPLKSVHLLHLQWAGVFPHHPAGEQQKLPFGSLGLH